LPAGIVPVTVTVCMPSGPAESCAQRISGCESGAPVVARLTKRTYAVSGAGVTTTGSPGAAPGATVTSTRLSFTAIGEITTLVPSSRSPSGNRLMSISTCPFTRVMCRAAT
jgi:hypothetical protein